MKLPIYELGIDGQSNLNTEGPELRQVGTGTTETSRDDILREYKTFDVIGRIAYLTETEATDDWTLEVVPGSTPLNGILISSDTYTLREYGFAIQLHTYGIRISYSYNRGFTNGYSSNIPAKRRVAKPTYQLVKLGYTLYVYYDGVLEFTAPLSTTYIKGKVVLLGTSTPTGSVGNNVPGNYDRVRFNPGLTLEPTMFIRAYDSLVKDVDLSNFAHSEIVVGDTVTKAVDLISTYKNHVIIKYTDTTMEAYYRPLGADKGNWFTEVKIDAEGIVSAKLNDGAVEVLGPRPPRKFTATGPELKGTGYKVGDKLLPIRTEGNLFYLEDGLLKSNPMTKQTLNLGNRVRATLSANKARTEELITPDKNELGQVIDKYYTFRPTYSQSKSKIGKEMCVGTNHTFMFNRGVYWIDGYVRVKTNISATIEIRDSDRKCLLDLGYVGTLTSNYGEDSNVIVRGLVYLYQDSEMLVAISGTSTNSAFQDTRLLDLNFYKVM